MSPVGLEIVGIITSDTTTLLIGVVPLLVTLKVYDMLSPTASGVHPCVLFGLAIFSMLIPQSFIVKTTGVLFVLIQVLSKSLTASAQNVLLPIALQMGFTALPPISWSYQNTDSLGPTDITVFASKT